MFFFVTFKLNTEKSVSKNSNLGALGAQNLQIWRLSLMSCISTSHLMKPGVGDLLATLG